MIQASRSVRFMVQSHKHFLIILTGILMLSGILLVPNSDLLTPSTLENSIILSDNEAATSNCRLLFNATFGTSSDEAASSLIQVASGGFAIAGTMFGKGHAADYWLVRTDQSGSQLWNRSFDAGQTENCKSVIECDDGGFALFGITRANQPSSVDYWLVRTDADGNHLWNTTFGTESADEGYDIIQCSDGGFVMVGCYTNSITNDLDYLMIKADQDGNHQWNFTYGGSDDDCCYSVLETSDNGFVLLGTFGNGTDEDVSIVRVAENGNYLWNHTYGGSLVDTAYDIISVREGGYCITGTTESFGSTGSDLWVLRIEDDGTLLWNQTYDGVIGDDDGQSLTEMNDGGFAIVGDINIGGDTMIWLLRTSDIGSLLWNTTYGTPGDSPESIVSIEEGGMAIAAVTSDIGAGGDDMWLLLVPELSWVKMPSIIRVEQDQPLNRELKAISAAGISSWALNDTTYFQIDSTGVLTSTTTLELGSYYLAVSVTDNMDNELTATLTIKAQETVTATTTGTPTGSITTDTSPHGQEPSNVGVLIIAILGGIAGFVLFAAIFQRYKRDS